MSNIPKSKRKPTQFQLFIDLSNIRHQLTEYICHDFSNENITYIRGTNNYNPQQWRYEHERILLIDTIDRLQRYITASNSIYPITIKEYFERRRLATCAISTVEYLIQELQYISHDFSIRTDKYVLKSFCLDFSNCSDAEIEAYRNGTKIINSLNFRKANTNTTKTICKGVGIGSEVSQIIGVFYPSCRLDNYIKIIKGCKFYGRYMDDFYIIHRDKVFLENILKDIQAISEQLGLHLNFKKTHIKPLNRTFIFLKTKYTLTDTGKVVMSLCPDTFKREAIKLRKFKKLYLNKRLTLDAIISQFKSWRGSVTRRQFHNHKAVKQIDNLFFQLFNLKYEDLRKWQKQQTKALKISLQKSLMQNMQD